DEQDGVTVELDARPDPQRSDNEGVFAAVADGSLRQLFIATLTPVEPRLDRRAASIVAPPPEGLRRAIRQREGGYTAELALPCRFLDERAGAPWERFRLNVALQDFGPDGT